MTILEQLSEDTLRQAVDAIAKRSALILSYELETGIDHEGAPAARVMLVIPDAACPVDEHAKMRPEAALPGGYLDVRSQLVQAMLQTDYMPSVRFITESERKELHGLHTNHSTEHRFP